MDNSPHVWITSRRLRNPHFSRQLSDNLQVVGSNLTGTRRVKTATSRELFNTGQKPAFIDHYGHVIESSLNECVGKSSVSLSAANLSSATLPCVSSSGVTLSGAATLPGSRTNSAHDTPVNDAGTVNPKDWRKNGHTHKQPDRSNTPTYSRPSMASIVESAWDGSDPTQAGIYIKTGSARPQTAHSRYSRATTMSASSRTSGCPSAEPRDASAEAAVRRWRYRPLSAVYNTIKAKRYLEGRLRDIYLQRRAVSASPQSKDISPTGHLSRTPRAGYDGRQQSRHGISVLSALSRFRMVGYIAIYLRRLMLVIIANCNEKTMRSATELQWMAVYSEKQDDLLAFNKYLFSRDRVIAHVPDWALTILSLPPEQRSEQHCRRLHALLRGLKSFDKFTEEMQLSLCRAFTLEKVQEGRVVLKSGHVGVNFYFIYSGSVFVNYEDVSLDGTPFMRTVAMLTRGDSFGELALLQDIRRTATISVREKCELLVVEKDVFASVCPKIFEKELAEKHAFLSTLDLFSPSFWSPEAIQSLCMNAQIQEYKINKVIVANSSLEDWIYACMEGKCQVIRCVSLDAEAKGPSKRKQSDVVLSEEILQLLAAASEHEHSNQTVDEGDMKENLLSSLGLDYVHTNKKVYLDKSHERERQRAILGLNDTTTLTALIKRQRETNKNLVFLHVGVIETGEIFDLQSLLNYGEESEVSSTLMLVSGGAKVLRVKKAAFFAQASPQALDNTRTLSSKKRNPSEEVILDSYKSKLIWDEFKARLVKSLVGRGAGDLSSALKNKQHKRQNKTQHQILTPQIQVTSEPDNCNSSDDDVNKADEQYDSHRLVPTKKPTMRRPSNYYEEIESVAKKEMVIIRRCPSAVRQHLRIARPIKSATHSPSVSSSLG